LISRVGILAVKEEPFDREAGFFLNEILDFRGCFPSGNDIADVLTGGFQFPGNIRLFKADFQENDIDSFLLNI